MQQFDVVNFKNLLFEQYCTYDSFGRLITFYVSIQKPSSDSLPLAVTVQGSGCHSVFRLDSNGQLRGGHQNLLLAAARGRSRVLVVEKPGVKVLDNPCKDGTAVGCSQTFLEEHTLPRWVEAIRSAIIATQAMPNINQDKLLLVGHSEGGIVAAKLAAEFQKVTHVALLSSTGPTQLYDFIALARTNKPLKESIKEEEIRVNKIYETFKNIQTDPESIIVFHWGHPNRRWSSFLSTSTLDELLKTNAHIYIAHGTNDQVIPLSSFDLLKAELTRHQRQFTTDCCLDADHTFHLTNSSSVQTVMGVLTRVIDWFLWQKP